MNNRTLLASVALFRELYDSEKDIYEVIGEFIKASILLERMWSFDATRACQSLSDTFGLDIPQAVVKTTLINRLTKAQAILNYEKGAFNVKDPELLKNQDLSEKFDQTSDRHTDLVQKVHDFTEKHYGKLGDDDRRNLTQCFLEFLSGGGQDSKFLPYVSSFVLRHGSDSEFISHLDDLREGMVIYDGIRHTPNIDSMRVWRDDFLIFLDPEHLFNAAGYNGDLYGQLFSEFYSLISDAKYKGKKKISLWYFESAEKEIDKVFYVAELIVQGKARPIPGQTAMEQIINGCSTPADVKQKKAELFSNLSRRRINNGEHLIPSERDEFNIASAELLADVERDAIRANVNFDENRCIVALDSLSKINALRGGDSKTQFERSAAILLTGSGQTRLAAFNERVRETTSAIPLATDIDFITNRLWFRLGKALSKHSLPKSLGVLAKAQIVLSSQVNDRVVKKYEKVEKDFDDGEISRESAEYLLNELRAHAIRPEDVEEKGLSELIQFIGSKDSYEEHLREKRHLEKKARDGELAISKLEEIERNEVRKKVKGKAMLLKTLISAGLIVYVMIILAFYAGSIWLIFFLADQSDSLLTVGMAIFSFVFATYQLIQFRKLKDALISRYFRSLRAIYRKEQKG